MADQKYIYESPDRGETIYRRKFGEIDRELYRVSTEVSDKLSAIKEDKLWGEIRRAAKSNKVLQDALERVILIYQLSKEHGTEQARRPF
jgi:phage host-nuclease inhibitor protein Gam